MSQRPPDDEDPIFETIFEQVKNAFSESEAGQFDTDNEDVLAGIRDSLRNLLNVTRPNLEPRVTVVEGGRSRNSPPTDRERPNLFVAESVDDIEDPSAHVSVCLLKSEDLAEMPFVSRYTASKGMIRLVDFEEKQLLFQGRAARHYRIHVHRGQMALHLDKALVAIVRSGQSIDVEAERIEVCSTSPELSVGEFFVLDES